MVKKYTTEEERKAAHKEAKKKWYQANKERISENYQANKERIAAQKAEWYQKNKERIAEHQSEYYQANRDKIVAQKAEYYQANKEEIAVKKAEYYQVNKERKAEYNAEYYATLIGRAVNLLNAYNREDKKYNRGKGNLTAKWIVDNIFSKPCHYCGESDWSKIGCDRIDNSKPHTEDNVVPCCAECNVKRGTKEYNKFVELMQNEGKA